MSEVGVVQTTCYILYIQVLHAAVSSYARVDLGRNTEFLLKVLSVVKNTGIHCHKTQYLLVNKVNYCCWFLFIFFFKMYAVLCG